MHPGPVTHKCRYVLVIRTSQYGQHISDQSERLVLKCTNCGVLFPTPLRMPREEFEQATIEDNTYKCPVCANFDTYTKSDLFYDTA